MSGALRHLLLALALLFSQQAAQLHAVSHLGHEGKGAPPVGHAAEQCLAFHALDGAMPVFATACDAPQAALPEVIGFTLPLLHPPRIVFDSRAPPVSV